ncbi:MAG: hypothetical protein JF593_00845 [Novosphingobium sp.]|nr:hypothetical protein [Novosphingobium sp.]
MPQDSETGDALRTAAERVVELESELEAAGEATLEGAAMARMREILHRWVDSVSGVVCSPGVGRVTLIHRDGAESKIASPNLPFLLSEPVSWATPAEAGPADG